MNNKKKRKDNKYAFHNILITIVFFFYFSPIYHSFKLMSFDYVTGLFRIEL